ncbi:MAG: peptidoglycan glycosyltransferase, partial [Clostridiales bacterium]|nr:peptidoglycan glycosyltransferase [Clostridiales bacterium]
MPKTFTRKKIFVVALVMIAAFVGLFTRLSYLMLVRSDYYYQKAQALHERERSIKAKRGVIYDRNGVEMAGNKPVCSVSVIHSQVTNEDEVVKQLCRVLNLDEEWVRKKVTTRSMREKIKSNVEKETADQLRELGMDGVMIDEDYKRYYPYNTLA